MKKLIPLVAMVASLACFTACEKNEIPTTDHIPPWRMIGTTSSDSALVVYFRNDVPMDTFVVGMYTDLSFEELLEDFRLTENNMVVALDQLYSSSKPADIIGWSDENGDDENYK